MTPTPMPALNSQFLLGGADGKQILVAPIVTQGQTQRNIYFPAGASWLPYYLGGDTANLNRFQTGGVSVGVTAGIDNVPIYVREGAVLPTRYPLSGKNKSINTYDLLDPLVLDVFGVTAKTSGLVYLDDGGVTTTAEDNGNYSTLQLDVASITATSVSFSLSVGNAKYPWSATVYVRLRAVGKVTQVVQNDTSIGKSSATNRSDFFKCNSSTTMPSYWMDTSTGSLWIAIPMNNQSTLTSVGITCSDVINVATAL